MNLASTAGSNSVDWKLVIGIPAALLAVIGLATYFVGVLRPLAVKQPRYWNEGDTTWFSCAVKNRSMLWDRNIDGISLIELPS